MSSRWILYGYKVFNDVFEIIPEEAETVRIIFDEYISGLSLKTIAEKLSADSVVYYKDKTTWNKNMISRIIENAHYAGDDKYPQIISKEVFESAIHRKNAIGGKREKDTAEIKYLKSVVYCSTCGKVIRRYSKYSTREKWICDNKCKVSVYFDDKTLFGKIVSVVSYVLSNPEILNCASNSTYEFDIETLRKTNDVRYMLDQGNVQFNPVKKVVFDCTESRFNCCPFDESTYTEPLKDYIKRQTISNKIDVQILSVIVDKIYINSDGSVTIRFVNGKEINSKKGEQDNAGSKNSNKNRSQSAFSVKAK